MPSSTVINDKQQLSFIYQPGVGLYDKKTTTTTDVDVHRLSFDLSPASSSFSDMSSPDSKTSTSHRPCLTRQNEQESSSNRPSQYSSNEILFNKTKRNTSSSCPIKSLDANTSDNQENQQKRRLDQNLHPKKKLRQEAATAEDRTRSSEHEQRSSRSKSRALTDENVQGQKLEEQRDVQQLRSNTNEFPQKQSITKMIKSNSMAKKSSIESSKTDVVQLDRDVPTIPSQGLLLCPKEDPTKKKKKKKISSTIISNTELFDEDQILDSILFNEMQSVQQQWQQFLIMTMEKELHVNPSDRKKKYKTEKFVRTNEFLLAYENLYDFDGMKHWYPIAK